MKRIFQVRHARIYQICVLTYLRAVGCDVAVPALKDESCNKTFDFVRGVERSAELTHGFSDTGSGIAIARIV
jgi:hypothetical protein